MMADVSNNNRPDPLLVGIAAVGAILLAWLGYVLYAAATNDSGELAGVRFRVVAVVVGNPRQIEVTIEVTKPPELALSCQVAAFTASGSSAGRLNAIPIDARADGHRTTTKTVVIPTPEEPAERASITQCLRSRSAS